MPRYADDSPPPREHRSRRRSLPDQRGLQDDYHGRRGPSRIRDSRYDDRRHRRRDEYDASDEDDHAPSRHRPRRAKGSPDISRPPIGPDRRVHDEIEPSRRHRRPPPQDFGDAPPRRSKSHRERGSHGAHHEPRRRDSVRDHGHGDRRPRHAHAGEDSEAEYARPRRRHGDRPSRHEDGYGTERPRRRAPPDDHDRGYRTDGRDHRDRRRGEDRQHRSSRRSPGPEGDDDPDRRGGRRGKMDMNHMIEKGHKGWKTVEPVAKPLLAQLAKQYLG